ncbi:MAG: histidinol-phosphate transaminase [Candidatus Hydrogenedens sp.]|nr:histidinol-phosphate transaminase [Candidatus Hydrogenedentota bacterium]NLF56816.1 histidinol-phosphate transaminase [Candidatus Hydrogenedens sp.]
MKHGRKLLAPVAGYTPGEQPTDPGVIKLNTNENPYPPSPKVMEALRALDPGALRRYPDPVSARFRAACAARHGLPGPEWVIAGNGMDELLSLVLRTFVDPGDDVLAPYPTYSLYEVLCALHGCRMVSVDLDGDFQLTEAFFKTPARLCFLARPNAPTGVAVPRGAVERLCREFPGIVVIDEAYVDFCDDHCMDFPERFENAIVMRTFSKSFSLAGMRVGVAAARPELINEFMKVKDSYNMNAVSQAVGLAAIEDYGYMRASAERVRATRAWLRAELTALGFNVPESQSNFLLARWAGTPNARGLFEALRGEKNILVRYFPHRMLADALRITVGTDDECAALVRALGEIIG